MNIIKTIFLFVLCLCSIIMKAQVPQSKSEPSGTTYGKIFSEFNTTISGSENQTAFEVKRAYLGYIKELEKGFSAEIKLDIGAPNDASSYSLLRRFAYFRNAALYYQYKQIRLEFGIIETAQFKEAESLWEKRYIYKSFQDEYQFGPSADIGFKAIYKAGIFTFDAGIYNGEGYSSLQNDNTFKGAIGITLQPFNGTTLRLYGDLSRKDLSQQTISCFAGHRFKRISLGAEYNRIYNLDFNNDQDRFGYSIFGKFDIYSFFNVFGRFDKIDSNKTSGSDVPWSLADDGSALIAGVEIKPIKKIRFSANYQDWYPAAKNIENESSFHFNVEVSF